MTSTSIADGSLREPGSRLSALGALFVLTLRQQAHGRRLLVLALLFLLPVALAFFGRHQKDQFEFVLVLNMIPHAMVPLAALLYASGMIQDEIEEQTLTYLLTRSLSKWHIITATSTYVFPPTTSYLSQHRPLLDFSAPP